MEGLTQAKSPSKDKLLSDDASVSSAISSPTSTISSPPSLEIKYPDGIEPITPISPSSEEPLDTKKTTTNMSFGEQLPPPPAVIDIKYALPQTTNPSLTPPKFSDKNLGDLVNLLKCSYKLLDVPQRDKYRAYIQDFCAYYGNIAHYEANPQLRYNAELIDLVFELIGDKKHIAIDKLFGLLVILSRQSRTKGPKQEPRLERIVQFLKESPTSPACKDGIRALINYAEANAVIIGDKGGLDILLNLLSSHMQDASFQTQVIWVLRNMAVTEPLRKPIMEKLGFLIVNSMNSHVQDIFLAESCCWALGNLALTEENGQFFSAVGAFPAAKNAIMVHNAKENVIEAACWFFFNITFDPNIIRGILRFGLDEPVTNLLKKYPNNKNITEWGNLILKRIRACLQLNSPQAISDRNANKPVREGPLIIIDGKGKPVKRHAILQPQRVAFCTTSTGLEITGEIRLKEVYDICVEGENKIILKTRVDYDKDKLIALEVPDKSLVEGWINDLKTTWEHAVAAITETSGPRPMPGVFNVPETIYLKDMEKTVDAIVLHEIYSDPHYVTHVFKSQKKFPGITLWDYFATLQTKKYSKEIVARVNEFKVSDTELYDLEKIKKEAAKIIVTQLMKDANEFDNNPVVNAPPVITRYEYCAKQGIRPTMEDKHIHMPFIDLMVGRDKKDDPVQYYAVYDGHGGVTVADYVERHLHVNVLKHPSFETDPKKALGEAFMSTNDELREHSDRLYMSNTAGSTGVVLVIKGRKLYVAWVGDSMASMFTATKSINLVDPHKPGSDSEKARIEKLGGFVSEEGGVMRVNGIVAVSRAFGNFRHKVILPEPDFKEFTLNGDEQYIVLACDGLWDVMNNDSLRKFIKKYIATHGRKTQGISEALVDEALRLGSTDNVSCIFIEFNWWKEPKRFF